MCVRVCVCVFTAITTDINLPLQQQADFASGKWCPEAKTVTVTFSHANWHFFSPLHCRYTHTHTHTPNTNTHKHSVNCCTWWPLLNANAFFSAVCFTSWFIGACVAPGNVRPRVCLQTSADFFFLYYPSYQSCHKVELYMTSWAFEIWGKWKYKRPPWNSRWYVLFQGAWKCVTPGNSWNEQQMIAEWSRSCH